MVGDGEESNQLLEVRCAVHCIYDVYEIFSFLRYSYYAMRANALSSNPTALNP